ncbi:MAG: phospholipid carrier-dependent glycosyltransferase [Synergistaceae bacterium]|jgi:4-amino-4-deoxy-L-arabinose transferase-like glycosyltransferase|nr:phospholipid carrier-dependent glycosyltransferase [Synergistaceae bacterium]
MKAAFAAALLLLTVTAYFLGLGSYDLLDPDEGRYSEIPREMLESGDFITPRLNYVKYFEKPVLHYWLTALPLGMGLPAEFASRLWPVLFALGGAGVAALFWGRCGLYTAAILSSSLLWFGVARMNITDMTVTFFITLSMAAWFRAFDGGADKKPALAPLLVFYAGMAMATLSKGLIGVVIPGGIIFWYSILTWRPRLMWRTLSWSGAALFAVLTVPWFWAVCRANPDFFYFFFVQEHFLRYATSMHGRWQPVWFFVPILVLGFVPWAGLLPGALADLIRERDDRHVFLGVWFAVPFLFFSLSSSKLVPYIAPCMPPLAILCGHALSLMEERQDVKKIRRFAAINGAVLMLLAAAALLYPLFERRIPAGTLYAYTIPAALTLTLLAAVGAASSLNPKRVFKIMCVIALVNAMVFGRGFVLKSEQDSRKGLAGVILEAERPGDVVVAYGDLMQSLGFYLKRRVVLADALGELEFGAAQEAPDERARWFIGGDGLKNLWNGEERVFLVAETGNLPRLRALLGDWVELASTDKNALVSNR